MYVLRVKMKCARETAAGKDFTPAGSAPPVSPPRQDGCASEVRLGCGYRVQKEWHTLCDRENCCMCCRPTFLALHLPVAENSRPHSGEFSLPQRCLLPWKHLLHGKFNLPVENMQVIEHYKDIRRTYDNFLKNSNMA